MYKEQRAEKQNNDGRYSRQILIEQIGEEGQEKLAASSVIVIGAGGLGSPALTYLAAAGIGCIGLVDSDKIALSNLNRQFLHNTCDIGKFKVDSAKEKLSNLNNEINIKTFNTHLTDGNAEEILSGFDIVIGAVDSFETRFVINKACVLLHKQGLHIPYIDGGINGFSGCVLFSNPPHTPCLNCVFPQDIEKKETQKKSNIGVLGTTAGIIGTIEANTALLFLLGLPNPIENKLLIYDGLRMSFDHIDIKRNENCSVCNKEK